MLTFAHDGPESLRLGIVVARHVRLDRPPLEVSRRINRLMERRSEDLSDEEDQFRTTVRDVFRNGSYKPTGRAKPASEYLLRWGESGNFPRINAAVDVCNYLSLKTLYPISVWDVDRADADFFRFRLGTPDESYVFNASGQEIRLHDLIVGCAVQEPADNGQPIVNAVKDSQKTKTHDETVNVAAAIYAPTAESPVQKLADTCAEFAHLLADPAVGGRASHGIVTAGGRLEL